MNVDVGTDILEEIGGFPPFPDIICSLEVLRWNWKWKCFCATSFLLPRRALLVTGSPHPFFFGGGAADRRKSPVSLFAA